MGAWVLLLRGVGASTQVPARLLRAVLAAEGFDRVTVLGHTGNAVLLSPLAREEVAARAREACAREIGFQKDIHVVAGADWAGLVERNPFPGAVEAPTTLHAAVLAADPDPARVAALQAIAPLDSPNELAVLGRVAYLHVPNGFSRSKLAERFDRGIGVPNTARNWNTVTRLHALVEAAEAPEPGRSP